MSKLQSFFANNLSSSQAVVAAMESPLLTPAAVVRIHYRKRRALSLCVWVGVCVTSIYTLVVDEFLLTAEFILWTLSNGFLRNVCMILMNIECFRFQVSFIFAGLPAVDAVQMFDLNLAIHTHTHQSWVYSVGLRYTELMELMWLWWHWVNSTVHI